MILLTEARATLASVSRRLTLGQQLVGAGAIVGISCGVAVELFHELLELISIRVLEPLIEAQGTLHFAGILLLPAIGAAAGAALIGAFSSELRGHGVDEVSSKISEGGHIPGRVAWVKLVASALTLGSGGSGGREGPVVQIGAAVGSSLGRHMPIPFKDIRMLAAAGASAGLAASFGVPLSAVVFTMEVVLHDFASEAFSAVVVASAAAAATSHLLIPKAVVTAMPVGSGEPLFDLLLCAIPAIACGLAGSLYMRSVTAVERLTHHHGGHSWASAALGGLIVGLIAWVLPEVMGTGGYTIAQALGGTPLGLRGAALAVAKIGATAATLGTGGSGGAFMPAMFVGAALGSGCRGALTRWLPGPPHGLFGLVGMSAAITSAYRAPMTAIVMALEISRGSQAAAPVMLGVAIAHLLTRVETPPRTIEV